MPQNATLSLLNVPFRSATAPTWTYQRFVVCCIFHEILAKWLILNKSFNLWDNFITSNAHMHIELNAHALIVFLITTQDHVKNSKCFYLGFLDHYHVRLLLELQEAWVVYFQWWSILVCSDCYKDYYIVCIYSSVRAGQSKFNPFVEVLTHNCKCILIQKSTALWLLQEGERLSPDRIFRVRSTQPYSESLPGTN